MDSPMTENEIKALIKCVHKLWYSEWTEDPSLALRLHRHMEALFNYAGIEDTLVENNPDAVTPEMFKIMTGAKE